MLLSKLLIGAIILANSLSDSHQTELPDPFGARDELTLTYKQCIFSHNEQNDRQNGSKKCLLVDEWLSLSSSLSFSRFREADSTGVSTKLTEFGLLADGLRDRFYLLQNEPDELSSNQRELTRCLPDQWHIHRHLFPWKYRLGSHEHSHKEPLDSSGIDPSAELIAPEIVYGVGAIWLNAIKRKSNISQSTDQHSWLMQNELDPTVRVEFRLDSELVKSIEIRQLSLYSQLAQQSNDGHADRHKITNYEERFVDIEILDSSQSKSSHRLASLVDEKLQMCRKQTDSTKLMPSLSWSLASSSQAPFYSIKYVKSHPNDDHSRPIVLINETFDYQLRAQLSRYSVLNQRGTKVENVFHRQFAKANNGCLEHHFIVQNNKVNSCWRSHLPNPQLKSSEPEMIHQVYFACCNQESTDGWQQGLGGLLSNAGDVLASDLRHLRRIVQIPTDPQRLVGAGMDLFVNQSTNEWLWRQGNREFQFYFKANDSDLSSWPTVSLEDLIRIEVSDGMSGLPSTRYDIVSMKIGSLKDVGQLDTNFDLPEICLTQPIELGSGDMRTEPRPVLSDDSVKFPSFYEFIRQTNAYLASYKVKRRHSASQIEVEARIHEQMNGNSRQSKFVVLRDKEYNFTNELYIDTNKDLMFNYEPKVTQLCNQISNLGSLVDFGNLQLDELNSTLSESTIDRQAHGLAKLWIQLMRLDGYQLNKIQDRQELYKLVKVGEGGSKTKVEASFSVSGGLLSSHKVYHLQRILVIHWETDENHIESVEISIEALDLVCKDAEIRLPKNCESLKAQIENKLHLTSNKSTKSGFPKLSSFLNSAGSLHIRSEITSQVPVIGENEHSYLMDEWKLNKDFRFISSGLRHNLNLLVYGNTRELFDLSKPFKCPPFLPTILGSTGSEQSKFFNILDDEQTVTSQLANLYYSPLLLWLQAEKRATITKLANMFILVPQPLDLEKNLGGQTPLNFELEMREEIWRVESPPDSKFTWKYNMHFERYTKSSDNLSVSMTSLEQPVLSKIEIIQDDSLVNTRRNVVIEVINIRRDINSAQELGVKFKLPEGYSCQRCKGLGGENADEFELNKDTEQFQELYYEATLETLANNEDNNWLPGASLSGVFIPPSGQRLISIQRTQSREPDGSWKSFKFVHEEASQLMYKIDQTNGHCAITRATDNLWRLQFSTSITLEISQYLFKLLFASLPEDSGKFHMINRYSSDGYLFSVYERKVDNLSLFTDRHYNSASIIRVFKRRDQDEADSKTKGGRINRHRSVSVKILLFDDELRRRIVRKVSIVLRHERDTKLADLVKWSNVAQCYNEANWILDRRVASFEIKYTIKGGAKMREPDSELIRQAFVDRLLENCNLSPLQLSAMPRVELNIDRQQASVYFELLDGPTAAERFERVFSTRMASKLEARALAKTVGSLSDCSGWCDQLADECRAMSFCADRTCLLLAAQVIARHGLSLADNMLDEHCVYFYATPASKPTMTAERFASSLDVAKNGDGPRSGDGLDKLRLNLSTFSLEPYTFVQLYRGLNSALKSNVDFEEGVFKLYKSKKWLEVARLEEPRTSSEEPALELGNCATVGPEQLENSGEDDIGDLATLTKKLEMDKSGCSIYSQDYLLYFDQFGDTRPHSGGAVVAKLDNYSALECAAACQGQPDTCRSFDLCVTSTPDADDAEGAETSCLLMNEHISFETFNKSLLQSSQSDGKPQVRCDHYSRSQLASYERMAHKQFDRAAPTVGGTLRGLSASECAIECRQDEQCFAFEHCFSLQSDPPQACTLSSYSLNSSAQATDQLQPSDDCSVYLWRVQEANLMVDETGSLAGTLTPGTSEHWTGWMTMIWLPGAVLVLSSSLQLVYTRLRGGRFV